MRSWVNNNEVWSGRQDTVKVQSGDDKKVFNDNDPN